MLGTASGIAINGQGEAAASPRRRGSRPALGGWPRLLLKTLRDKIARAIALVMRPKRIKFAIVSMKPQDFGFEEIDLGTVAFTSELLSCSA
jgi:hypothetical protein